MLLQRKKDHTAYTMIEMLIVLVIISLTAAILFVAFGPSREKSKKTSCISQLRQVYLATMMYREDYDGIEPVVGQRISHTQLGLPYEPSHVIHFVNNYLKDSSLLLCPALSPDDRRAYALHSGEDFITRENKSNSEVWYKMGNRSPLWTCMEHNPLINLGEAPRWTTKKVLIVRFNGSIDTRTAPLVGGFPYEGID
ncbi:MAG: hypothetical protein OHK0029_28200 [Armatimonadaceae bacterium]